ncbi:hypothetical protein HGQ17_14645 [Nesterenkonia sp. MY13]|uniref:Pilus assembly protein n=1 Tax=Nesterenkonia sedimenti TaxID=1463632 RepID=A0A7X8YEW2_9MICC|nr:hypothetical protein [Nesterenkonia sedimenti]NLS11213.1 hypothetical protein [Nesterenkonia sedimenti]
MSMNEEEGSAVVEFLALAVLLLIPTVWFLVAVAQVQSAAYAVTGAADQAAKVYVTSPHGHQQSAAHSEAAVQRALGDFGIDPGQAEIRQSCSADCQEPGSVVQFDIELRVPVPLVPEFGGWEHRLVTVSASAAQVQHDAAEGAP